jgi:hypothetical protein
MPLFRKPLRYRSSATGIPADFASRIALLNPTEDHDQHWHTPGIFISKGIIAACVLLVMALVLSAVTYAAQPKPEPPRLSLSVTSLVDADGGE